ncbi:MAG: phenylacetate--CoA ligase family protein [Gemmatimonadota bacterium]
MELPRKLLEFQRLRSHLRIDPAALGELREQKLRSLVDHVWRYVPFYRTRFEEAGIDPGSIRTLEDLKRIPITTKDDLRAAGPEAILARGTDPATCIRYPTGGTTGKSLVVLANPAEARTRLLVEMRGLGATGLLRPHERLVVLGPTHWDPGHAYQRLGLFRRDYISPRLPVDDQIARLERLRPAVLWAYPSVLLAIVERLGGRLSAALRPRALITSAEGIPPELASAIRADLDLEWFNFYGAMETGRIAWECRAHDGLHLNADRLVLERLAEPDAEARTVVTALDSRTMPILRYDLGDEADFIEGDCRCGLPFARITAPRGKICDMVRLPGGRSLSSWALRSIVRDHPEVDQYQMRQMAPDYLVVHVVPRESAPDPGPELERRLRSRLGPSVRLDVLTGPSISGPQRTTFVSDL